MATDFHPYENIIIKAGETRPYIALNMVSSVDGNVTPSKLGSSTDRKVMNDIRSYFDAVICGAKTIKKHPYYLGVPESLERVRVQRGLSPQPLTIVISGSGHLPGHGPLFEDSPLTPIAITTEAGAPHIPPHWQVEICGTERIDFDSLIARLWDKFRIKRLLLEGGPTLNYLFLSNKAIDEIFWTIAPRIIGSSHELGLVNGDKPIIPSPKLRLLSAAPHNHEIFTRYAITYEEPSS